jgi:hypothetical protein
MANMLAQQAPSFDVYGHNFFYQIKTNLEKFRWF